MSRQRILFFFPAFFDFQPKHEIRSGVFFEKLSQELSSNAFLDPKNGGKIMLKNYFKIALRNLLRHKAYSGVNIFGLAAGLTCCLFILMYVQNKLSYDRFHENADRVYRIVPDLETPRGLRELAQSSPPLAAALKAKFPEIQETARLVRTRGLFAVGENRFYENQVFYSDETIFDVFTYPLQQGDPATALVEPNSIVLTQELAQKYFGDADPMNQTLLINNERSLKVTGVFAPIPGTTHLPFSALISHKTYEALRPQWVGEWGAFFYQTYILTPSDFDLAAFTAGLPDFVEEAVGPGFGIILRAQPLTEIYLNSHRRGEVGVRGNVTLIYVLVGIAVLILAIACTNFMNLATARSSRRAREVGMRKVVGAVRRQLAWQFIGETIMLSFFATVLATALCQLLLPLFNQLTGEEIGFSLFENSAVLFALLSLSFLVGAIAGSYPAFVLSKFRPATVLKGVFSKTASGVKMRHALVIFQFSLSVMLIVSTIVILRQVEFFRTKGLGFNEKQLLVIDFKGDQAVRGQADFIKNEFFSHADVQATALSSSVPGKGVTYDHAFVIDGADSLDMFFGTYRVDFDFVSNYELELLAGRTFSLQFRQDSSTAVIINEASLSKLGWTEPEQAIGKKVSFGGPAGEIIGVVKSFNFNSLHEPVEPLAMYIDPASASYFTLRFETQNLPQFIADLGRKWRELAPQQPFDYFFLDDQLDAQYRDEVRFGQIFAVAAGLAILIACLGLLGLAAFAVEQRTKEIGLRKVLGASVSGVTALLSKDFVKLVVAANLIAWPAAWFAMNKWLENFAYRIEISWWIFVLAGGIALVIALMTVSTQAIRAALANPVESLKYE